MTSGPTNDMSIEIQKLQVLPQPKGSLQVTFLPNCPNPEFLPKPIQINIHVGQFWYNHVTSMVWRIRRIKGVSSVFLYAVVNDLVHEPERLTKEVAVSQLLDNYSMAIEPTARKIKEDTKTCNDNVLNNIL